MVRVCPSCERIAEAARCACGARRPAEGWPPDPKLGTVIADRYELVEHLAAGGFGTVYAARERRAGVDLGMVAVKIARMAALPAVLAEARSARLVSSPHVVKVFDAGATEDGQAYLVMELLRWGNLADTISEGPLSAERVRRIALPIAEALHELHGAGFVHRDVKPANVLLGPRDFAKLLDFGIARSRAALASGDARIVGTRGYMAPEQLDGGPIDERVDVYALGVLIAHALQGSPEDPDRALPHALRRMVSQLPEERPSLPQVIALLGDERASVPTTRAASPARTTTITAPPEAVKRASARPASGVVGTMLPPIEALPVSIGSSPFRVKGTGYQGALSAYDRLVPGGRAQVIARLHPSVAAYFTQPLLAASWYDVLPLLYCEHAAARLAGLSLRELVRVGTTQHAEHDLGGVYRFVVRALAPSTTLRAILRLSTRLTDFGEPRLEQTSSASFRVWWDGLPMLLLDWFVTATEAYLAVALTKAGAVGVRTWRGPVERTGERAGFAIVRGVLWVSWSEASTQEERARASIA